ncbi:hypothetical protein [Anabaena azotica]|uniref:Uncharacterized protein n=1 Tax=Anabaena azotica FACHB-119 TaxID=947527 RepID=A0ABR8DC27_9NOST|nr:hypothetical protein [Anabaena azotica]MBD2504689.1 hypothetical protein [Anabaena azotica FACHB-119]
MKFFIPGANSLESEQNVYESIKLNLGKGRGVEFSERRIRMLKWRHDGKQYEAEVGEFTSFNNEPVIAILFDPQRKLYHVCTPNRGVLRDTSVLAGESSVIDFTDFDRE